MSHDLAKETKVSSSASKSDKKRSGKAKAAASAAAANPYAGNNSDGEDTYDEVSSNGVFITFQGKEQTFDAFIESLNNKHDRDEAVACLFTSKFKAFNAQQPPITPQMADDLLNGVRAAMGFGAGAGRKGNKGKASSTDSVPSPDTCAARVKAVECGTALILCCGADVESRKLFDTWGTVLAATVTSIIKGLRSQMEEFIHESNTAEGSVKALIASPAGITSSISAAQRKALSEIAGRCYDLLVKCFESLALLHSLDPSMSVNEENESLPTALLQLANLVIPDFGVQSRAEVGNAFPTADKPDVSFYIPIEASGALLKCLVSCCEPAQGSKARASLLRLHRYVTGTTAVNVIASYDDDEDEETVSSVPSDDGTDSSAASPHKGTYTGLFHTLIVALAQSIGILGSRFPEMIAQEDSEVSPSILSSISSPTVVAPQSAGSAFVTTPLLSVEHHLVPLSKILARKAMGRGKCRREAQLVLRQAAKKLGSLNGSNIDSLEDHESQRKSRKAAPRSGVAAGLDSTVGSPTSKAAAKFPTSGSSSPPPKSGESPPPDALPSHNPNRDVDDDDGEEAAGAGACESSDGSDPQEVIQFRDKISLTFVGFQQIYLAACLRSVTYEGLQKQLAQNPIVRQLFNIKEDLTRKVDRNERREQLIEAEASKLEERRERQKERDSKAKAREYSEDY